MAAFADLALLKRQCRVEHDEDDVLIAAYAEAASDHVRAYHLVPEPTPSAVVAAVLLMTADLYANRESVVLGTIAAEVKMPTTVANLLAPYRNWTV